MWMHHILIKNDKIILKLITIKTKPQNASWVGKDFFT